MRTLKITKLILEGSAYKRTLNINHSLVIIKGDGFSGKSLILKLIAYCLGSKSDLIDLSVQTELKENCDEVFLEVEVNGKAFTLHRHLKNEKNIIQIYLTKYEDYEEYSPWRKSVDEFLDFLVNELGISLHTILKKKSGSKDLIPEKISFRDLMRYIFIKQNELGTNHFIDNLNTFVSGKNKEVFKIINDLVIPDIEEIEREIQLKQNEFNRLESINNGLEEYLTNRESLVLLELLSARRTLEENIENLKIQKKAIVEKRKCDKDDLHYQLKAEVNQINSSIMEYEQQINTYDLSLTNKQLLLTDYKEELEKLEATLEAMKKIKIIDQKHTCPLCNSFVSVSVDEEENCEDIEKVVEQLKNKIEMLEELSRNEVNKVNQLKDQLNKLVEKRNVYNTALHEYRENIDVPYLAEIESINSIIRDYTLEKNKISSLVDIHNDITKNLGTVERLKADLQKLKKRKEDQAKLSIRQEIILDKLNSKYRNLMYRFNFTDIAEERCFISKENYLPYYSEASVMKHTSGCLLLCMQISYLGAILELNHEEESNCHPSLLMLDTVSNNIGTDKNELDSVDPKTYEEIYKYLMELSKFNQIFIIDNTPPEISIEYTQFFFHRVNPGEKLKGLIDELKNEKTFEKLC